jgi:hypothetical protein
MADQATTTKASSIRGRLRAPFMIIGPGNQTDYLVDRPRLLASLVLFDHVVFESYRLLELPDLVSMFGATGLADLLDARALCVQVAFITMGHRWTTPDHVAFTSMASTPDVMQTSLRGALPKLAATPLAERRRLEETLLRQHEDLPEGIGRVTLDAFTGAVLQERPVLRSAFERAAGKPMPDGVRFDIRRAEEGLYVAPHWLRNLPQKERARLVEKSLGAVANLTVEKEKMRARNALAGFRESELPLFEEDLRFLSGTVDPEQQLRTFDRVLDLSGEEGVASRLEKERVDVERLLKVRASREVREFRAWLWEMHDASDEEIREQVEGVRKEAGRFLVSTPGRALRWLAGVGIGAIPVAGPIAGAALGAADTFLLEKVLPSSGVVTFIGDMYKQLFDT